MDYIIKKASSLPLVDQLSSGLFGIPDDWPVESEVYAGVVPDGWELISDSSLSTLYSTNLSAYDSWLASKAQTSLPKGTTLVASFIDMGTSVNGKFLSTENGTSDEAPALMAQDFAITLVAYSSPTPPTSGTIEIRVNTAVGTPAATVSLDGTKSQLSAIDVKVIQGDTINCKVVSASGVNKPSVKLYSSNH